MGSCRRRIEHTRWGFSAALRVIAGRYARGSAGAYFFSSVL